MNSGEYLVELFNRALTAPLCTMLFSLSKRSLAGRFAEMMIIIWIFINIQGTANHRTETGCITSGSEQNYPRKLEISSVFLCGNILVLTLMS